MSEQDRDVTFTFKLTRPDDVTPEAWDECIRLAKENKNVHWRVDAVKPFGASGVKFSGPIGLAPAFIERTDGTMQLVEVSLVPYKPGDEQYGVHPVEIVETEGES